MWQRWAGGGENERRSRQAAGRLMSGAGRLMPVNGSADSRVCREHADESLRESTVLTGSSGSGEPVVEKELAPEISGIVISAQGGGNASVQKEISEAMQALFGLPAHKIKVLKRVE